MWNSGIMYDLAKERQADLRREAEQARTARTAAHSTAAAGRTVRFFRRMAEQAGEWIVVRGWAEPAEPATAPITQREQLAC